MGNYTVIPSLLIKNITIIFIMFIYVLSRLLSCLLIIIILFVMFSYQYITVTLIYVHQTFLDVFNDSGRYPTNCSFFKKMGRAMDGKGQLP